MRFRYWWLVPLAVSLAGAGEAQEIHKCVAHGGLAYQNLPCGEGQADAGVLKLPDYADPAQRDGASAPALDAPAATASDAVSGTPATPQDGPMSQAAFPFRTSIALGMTDDQVLNIARWGRPSRITRTGRHRGWREVWTYDRGNDVRELSFVNGRLADIGMPAGAQETLASLTR
jgi:hypothetical protein